MKNAPNIFPQAVVDTARRHAEAQFPKEACGFVIGGEYTPAENASPTPETHFLIRDNETRRAYQSGALQGLIHSHPNGQRFPSKRDMEKQMQMALPWGVLVLSPSGGATVDYFELGDHMLDAPLVGCQWRPAIHDCFGLVRRYMWQVQGTKLPNIARTDDWWDTDTEAFYHQHRPAFDMMEEVPVSSLSAGDVILFAIGGPDPNHFAVYEGGNVILHHMTNGLSARRPLNTLQAKIHTAFRLRKAVQPVANQE